jgi:hypothetical protein
VFAWLSYDWDHWLDAKVCVPCEEFSRALGRACRLVDPYSLDAPFDDLTNAAREEFADGDLDYELHTKRPGLRFKLRRQLVELERRKRAAFVVDHPTLVKT